MSDERKATRWFSEVRARMGQSGHRALEDGQPGDPGHAGPRKIASVLKRVAANVLPERDKYLRDMSNDYYAMWLDPRMVYSCAYFERGDEDLATAQLNKIDHILTKVGLRPGHTLLDVDCGWGALVMRAAEKFGARCVGVTTSKNQFDWATECVKAAGLTENVEIRLQASSDVTGRFDRIASLGMFEYDGRSDLPEYVARLQERLAGDGVLVSHCIMSAGSSSGGPGFDDSAFHSRYVFPDDELPDLGYALTTMQDGGLEVSCVENLRRHCVRTLRLWEANFKAKETTLRQLVDERSLWSWRDYLRDWAMAFEQDDVSMYEIVGRKVGTRASVLPWPGGAD